MTLREALTTLTISGKIAVLKEIDSAIISLIRGARSATISASGVSKSYTKEGLKELRELRRELKLEIAVAMNGGRSYRLEGMRVL